MKKKLMKLLPFLMLMFVLVFTTNTAEAADVVESGDTYTLTDDGVLTVKKSSFEYDDVRNQQLVTKIVFTGKVTVITHGMIAFLHPDNKFVNVTEIEVQKGVHAISDIAFNAMKKLKKITIADSVESLGVRAFSGCSALKTVQLPSNLEDIPEECFWGCSALTTINLD